MSFKNICCSSEISKWHSMGCTWPLRDQTAAPGAYDLGAATPFAFCYCCWSLQARPLSSSFHCLCFHSPRIGSTASRAEGAWPGAWEGSGDLMQYSRSCLLHGKGNASMAWQVCVGGVLCGAAEGPVQFIPSHSEGAQPCCSLSYKIIGFGTEIMG